MQRLIIPRGEKGLRGVRDIRRQNDRLARGGEFFHRVAKLGGDAFSGVARMDIEHVEHVRALEAGETDDISAQQRHQGQRPGERLRKSRLVLGDGAPGLDLGLAVVLNAKLFDTGAENLGQDRRIGRQSGTQGYFFGGGHQSNP